MEHIDDLDETQLQNAHILVHSLSLRTHYAMIQIGVRESLSTFTKEIESCLYLHKRWHSTLLDLSLREKSRPTKDSSGELHLQYLIGVCNKPSN